MTSPQGIPVGAVHGFLRDVLELRQRWQPSHLVCVFDASEITFRNELYDDYKSNRDPMPDELRPQIGLIQQSLNALGIPVISINGFEADDILATLSLEAERANAKCLLVTSDKDCRQLISEQVQMFNIRKTEIFGIDQLRETWGIRPDQVVDFQALVGDSVDNVPGVPLIGPKLAQQLIEQFGTLENVLDHADEVKGKKRSENLKTYRDQALLSRQLVELKRDVPDANRWEAWGQLTADLDEARKLFTEFGFRRLAERFLESVENASADRVHEAAAGLEASAEDPNEANSADTIQVATKRTTVKFSRDGYRIIETEKQLKELCERLRHCERIAVDTETTSLSARDCDLVGISLCWSIGEAAYVPIRSPQGDASLPIEVVRQHLANVLADSTIQKVGQNIKFDMIVLRSHEMPIHGIYFDSMVADYLLNAGWRNHTLDNIAERYFEHKMISIRELIGTGKSQRRMDEVPLAEIGIYACEDVDIPFRLVQPMELELENQGLMELFRNLEIPLLGSLAEMEFNGVSIDTAHLQNLANDFQAKIESLHSEILELAGESFNPDSPKQLARILFDVLGLRAVKKTRTGPSTDVEVLHALESDHPLPAKVIEYRQATKLKSTYIDSLPNLISKRTHRVHTSFRQDVAATGRLSSSEPNLQNIPIRTDEGKKIRAAFRPDPSDWIWLAADYSQIELRVLAHYCGDPTLIRAFAEDQDIHALVAAEVYDLELDEVTSDLRRNAKAINFGIIYGQSPFGLAKALNISRQEASEFIESYFARYERVQEFIANTLRDCRKNGYVSTLAGRRRWLKGVRDYDSLTPQRKRSLIEPERMAINTVIQGSAADLIKMAMVRLHSDIESSDLQARMLLQIHDELIFEVHPSDSEALASLVEERMNQVAELAVPLRVDLQTGNNWAEC